ncbi:radical SAM protein, partial [Bacillus cereus]
ICEKMDYSAHNSPKVFNRGFLYETSRGCPFQCSYCNTETHRRLYRKKSIVKIKRELEEMVYKHGAEYVYFIDESFGYDNDWITKVIDVLKDLPVEWGCQGNLKFTTPEKLRKMAESGCINMEFGFETFNYDILKKSKKINDLDRAKEVLESAIDVGISPVLFLLVGLPGESLETLKNTVDFLKSLRSGFRFSTGIPIPYPNTEYYRKGVKEGIIKPGQDDESLYELSGIIGNNLFWNIEKKNEFFNKYGPNIWGNKLNLERFENDLFDCFETRKELNHV